MIVVLDLKSQQLQTTGENNQQQNSQKMEDASSDQLKSNAITLTKRNIQSYEIKIYTTISYKPTETFFKVFYM